MRLDLTCELGMYLSILYACRMSICPKKVTCYVCKSISMCLSRKVKNAYIEKRRGFETHSWPGGRPFAQVCFTP